MLALEADALQRAANGPRTWAVQRPALAHALRDRPSITTEQVAAIRSVTMTDAPVAVIVGHAGTGKTFALDAARAAWTETGLHTRGVALAARAARELEAGSGIPSQTIASLVSDLDRGTLRLGPKDVVVVDEAGMVGTRHLHRLIDATTSAGAKLVLVGDPKQLAEIDAGGLFTSLAHRLGHAELTENRRLNDPAQYATARALRHGEIHDALRRMERAGNLTLDPNADRLRDRSSLRLVFLNACGTARSVPAEPFGGLATALLRAGIPSVVAMQCPIADRAASEGQVVTFTASASDVDVGDGITYSLTSAPAGAATSTSSRRRSTRW